VGCIYRRGKKYWIKYYRNGKPYSESTHSDKKEVAKKLLNTREGEIAKGQLPGIYLDKVTFDELGKDLITDYRINKRKSVDRVELAVKHLEKVFCGVKAVNIDTASVKMYIERRMEAGMANASINRELAALKRMFRLGARCTPVKVGLVPYIPMLRESNTRKGFFEHEDFLKLRDDLPDYLRPVVTFAYHTGWRKAEILNLTWDKVGNDVFERRRRIPRGHAPGQAAVVRRESVLDAVNEELLQGFLQRLSTLRRHQTSGDGPLDPCMDLGGAHEQVPCHRGIRPLAFAHGDELQKDIDVLGFKNHGSLIFVIRE